MKDEDEDEGSSGATSSVEESTNNNRDDNPNLETSVSGTDESWLTYCLSYLWYRTSEEKVVKSEACLLSCLKQKHTMRHVNIGPVLGEDNKDINIWTYSANEDIEETPLVLIHGMASGLALWILNLDHFVASKSRPVYAIDLPGFGRSSRPDFSTEPSEVEEQYVKILEAWRKRIHVEKMVLLGHSLGAYLSFSYSLKHPSRVAHLICAEPWGFNRQPKSLSDIKHIPVHHRILVQILCKLPLNPLWAIRVAGPLGPHVVKRIRRDLIHNYADCMDDPWSCVANYIYYINVQNPTGEAAFSTLMSCFGWAKNPMHLRIEKLSSEIPLTLIYGCRSWVDHYPAEQVAQRRKGSYVDYHIIQSGHHVYADQYDIFNEIVLRACRKRLN